MLKNKKFEFGEKLLRQKCGTVLGMKFAQPNKNILPEQFYLNKMKQAGLNHPVDGFNSFHLYRNLNYKISKTFHCNSNNVLYLIERRICGEQYIGSVASFEKNF